jgi:hypothetical protein
MFSTPGAAHGFPSSLSGPTQATLNTSSATSAGCPLAISNGDKRGLGAMTYYDLGAMENFPFLNFTGQMTHLKWGFPMAPFDDRRVPMKFIKRLCDGHIWAKGFHQRRMGFKNSLVSEILAT